LYALQPLFIKVLQVALSELHFGLKKELFIVGALFFSGLSPGSALSQNEPTLLPYYLFKA
jgi:hypothetical protein